MSVNRRQFLGLAALGSTALIAGKSHALEPLEPVDCQSNCGVLVDTVVCIGCRKCEWACNNQHKLSDKPLKEFEDKSVFAEHRRPHASSYTVVNQFTDPATKKGFNIKVQCMHCNHPACVSACIVGALTKSENGPVVYDGWKCIGCRYCMIACPFQIPAYEYANALDPVVRKCSFCSERNLEGGQEPACVEICPNEALTFGSRQELIDLAHSKIKMYPGRYYDHVYGEHEIGGTSWLYIAPCDFKNTELPTLNDEPIPPKTETIQHALFKWFLPPVALYGLLGLIMHTLKDDEREDAEVTK